MGKSFSNIKKRPADFSTETTTRPQVEMKARKLGIDVYLNRVDVSKSQKK